MEMESRLASVDGSRRSVECSVLFGGVTMFTSSLQEERGALASLGLALFAVWTNHIQVWYMLGARRHVMSLTSTYLSTFEETGGGA